MTHAAPESFLQALEEQRRDYAAGIPARIAAMELLWHGVTDAGGNAGDMERLARKAHGVAGSGAIFGFARLGGAARALELELHAALDADAPLDAARQAALEARMQSLRSCMGEAP